MFKNKLILDLFNSRMYQERKLRREIRREIGFSSILAVYYQRSLSTAASRIQLASI